MSELVARPELIAREPVGAEPTVTVAVLTYKRPAQLERILPLLVEQANSLASPASVLVVDNDPDASAREAVAAWSSNGVRYVHEPKPGIAAARNRAMDEAGADVDALVFIDDDETPVGAWLPSLVAQWQRDGSAAVAGPVRRTFDGEPDPWVIGSEVFARRTFKSGEDVPWAATSNLLLDMKAIRGYGLTFDERYGISGGSDSLFTKKLVQLGGVIRWCDEAEVLDPVPAARATRAWVAKRTLRLGNVWTRTRVDTATSRFHRFVRRADAHKLAAYVFLRGLIFTVRGVVSRNPAQRGYGICRITSGIGVLSGAYGYVYHEYRRSE